MTSLDAEANRLARLPPAERRTRAAQLVRRESDWAAWVAALNVLHVSAPEREAVAAAALSAAAGRQRDAVLAARLRLLEGRALQRAGSPRDAVVAFERAARGLRAVGDPVRAVQADVLRVDALAHAARGAEALALADVCATRLRGPHAAAWRGALAINRANALRLSGDLGAAVRLYDGAARSATRRGDPLSAAIARSNAGTALMDAGEAERALSRFEAALRVFEGAGHEDMAAEVRANRAAALVRAGRLGEGLAALEREERRHAARGLGRRVALLRMDLADAFLRAGDAPAAERRALGAVEAFRKARAPAEAVEAWWLAAAAVGRVDVRRARRYVQRALDAARRADRPSYALRSELLRHDLDLRAGRRVDGRTLAALSRKADRLGQREIVAEVALLRAHAALDAGRWQAAARILDDHALEGAGRPWIRAARETGRALVDARRGRTGDALRRLRRVAVFLDAVRAGLPGPWLRTTFVLRHLDPHLTRVDLLLERGEAADRAEAEALLDTLAARRFVDARAVPHRGNPRLARLRRRLEVIYDRLARGSGPTRGLDPREAVLLEREAARLERRAAEAWRSEERRAVPALGVELAHPVPAPLRGDRAAVHVWRQGGRVRGLVRDRQHVGDACDLGSVADLAAACQLLAFHDERARVRPRAGPALDASLAALRNRLLAPLGADGWPRTVEILHDPSLPDVPWELLALGGVPLAFRHRLRRVPTRYPAPPGGGGARGATVVAVGDASLPGARREVRAIGRRARVLAGPKATRASLADALGTRALVHVAGHGYEATEAPGLAGIRLADGWFGVPDVPSRVVATLVVLAACRSGRISGLAGEAWGGLPSALLAAGARTVVWTSGDVDDGIAADLMERFYAFDPTRDPESALGHALADVWSARGSAAGLFEFRLSGRAR